MIVCDAECWKPIPGFVGRFEASDAGRIRSVKQHMMKLQMSPHGYLFVRTHVGNRFAHRLVALAFVSPPTDAGQDCVNHINGVKTDNRAVNLEWCTRKENNHHAMALGLGLYMPPRIAGEAHHFAKLTWAKVAEARSKWATGATIRALAREHGVDKATMSDALHGRTWTTP